MPVTYDLDDGLIALRLSGEYAPTEIKSALLDALDDPRLPGDAQLLFDLRESRSIQDRTADDVRDMARFLAAHGQRFGNRVAMVTNGDLAFGLMRLGAVTAQSGGVEAEVFRDIHSARAWLDR